MVGIWGQTVLIEPARDLVVVRLGYTQKDCPTSHIEPIAELFPADAVPDREQKRR
jgi:hypothetical protein